MSKASRRLYLADDRETVVFEGDPRAAFLLVSEGKDIPDGFAEPKPEKPSARVAAKPEGKPTRKRATKSKD